MLAWADGLIWREKGFSDNQTGVVVWWCEEVPSLWVARARSCSLVRAGSKKPEGRAIVGGQVVRVWQNGW